MKGDVSVARGSNHSCPSSAVVDDRKAIKRAFGDDGRMVHISRCEMSSLSVYKGFPAMKSGKAT